jgi:hypothetical protein
MGNSMKTRTLAASILLAAFGAACSGGGGSSPAPKAATSSATPASSTSGSASPGAAAALPPGTVGVTLTLKIPQHTTSAVVRLKPSATRKQPAFIQTQTNGVQATVTPASGPVVLTLTGSCLPVVDPTVCTIVVPIPLNVNSSVVVQLLEGSIAIGQASANFSAGEFTDGVAQTYATSLIFKPMIGTVIVTWGPNGPPGTFFGGSTTPTFGAKVILEDTAGNDVGNELDGVLDSLGNPFTTLTVTSTGFTPYATFPYVVNLLPGNPASDIVISVNGLAPDGVTANPDIKPLVGGLTYSAIPLSLSVGYLYSP